MAPRPSAVARFVDHGLEERANDATKQWWTDYLKGEAEFRGVKMADIRAVARAANDRFDLDRYEVADLLAVTDHLFAQSETEDKLCATLLLAEHHFDRLGTDDVERLAGPLERDELADWNSCDWYCVKLLGPFVAARDSKARAMEIASWKDRPGLWQRRAAGVAFVDLVTRPPLFAGMHDLVLSVCERNVHDPTRWSQTSVGWVLRELSKQAPDIVEAFVERNADLMSSEARRAATKRLGDTTRPRTRRRPR
jgi:3-methyladenine DNA glycosylase AlkD